MKLAGVVFLLAGLAAIAATFLLYEKDPDRTAAAICAAWWVGLSFAIGALALVATTNVTHASWFVVFRPAATAIVVATPILALGFLPSAIVAHRVYPWASAAWPVHARTIVSLGVWSTLSFALHHRRASAAALPLLAITATVTPFDWLMRIEPGWSSTVYGLYVLVSGFCGAIGVIAMVPARDAKPDHVHALGRLMLAGVCLWAYLGFFQLMLQWIGNLPSEVPFYVRRAAGPWGIVSAALFLGHFVVPFSLLLSRPLKRSARGVAAVGALLAIMHVVDIAWLVLPAKTPSPFLGALAPIVAVLCIGVACVLFRASPRAAEDPEYARAMRYESP